MLFVNIAVVLLVPFLMMGIIKKTKAFWGGRKGVSLFQPLFDFIRLMKKDFVISTATSSVFVIAPVVCFCSVIFASAFVPLVNGTTIVNVQAGFIIFAYLLGIGKFFSLIGAMDTGSSFEGMGASREACFTTIVEPAFFVILASIMLVTGNYTFSGVVNFITEAEGYGFLITVITVVSLMLMILIEGSRVPVDDPATHLELTMIHEVMILDNSASDLALLTWGNSIKMLLLSSIIINLILPPDLALLPALGLYLLLIFIISVTIGTVESAMARIRMSRVFEFVFVMNSLSLVVLALAVANGFGG